jgi:hypothetical protein
MSQAYEEAAPDFELLRRRNLADASTATDRLIDVNEAPGSSSTGSFMSHELIAHDTLSHETIAKHLRFDVGRREFFWLANDLMAAPADIAIRGNFAVLDYLRTPEGQLERVIHSLSVGTRLPYAPRLARRLMTLLRAAEEDGQGWAENSVESLRRMIIFLETVPRFAYPTVTITPSGTFRAQWTKARNAHFAIDFLSEGRVRFVVFAPDARHPQRVRQVSGLSCWESVLEEVAPYRVHEWATRAGP